MLADEPESGVHTAARKDLRRAPPAIADPESERLREAYAAEQQQRAAAESIDRAEARRAEAEKRAHVDAEFVRQEARRREQAERKRAARHAARETKREHTRSRRETKSEERRRRAREWAEEDERRSAEQEQRSARVAAEYEEAMRRGREYAEAQERARLGHGAEQRPSAAASWVDGVPASFADKLRGVMAGAGRHARPVRRAFMRKLMLLLHPDRCIDSKPEPALYELAGSTAEVDALDREFHAAIGRAAEPVRDVCVPATQAAAALQLPVFGESLLGGHGA